jgi:UDP-N-acetylglucosamine 2-epimerase (non-hydrolysing)
MTHILCVVGARPNFMKMAPIMAALKAEGFAVTLVHTGQHYDAAMNDVVFEQLRLPVPDVNLEVGSASHAQQTGEVMKRIEPVLVEKKPDAILVVGDVNSTLAAALVAVKLGIRVVHVEAGLRSRDRTMPEEINRILTDQISDILFTTEREAQRNLAAEGIADDRIVFAGNVMIDSLRANLAGAVSPSQSAGQALGAKGYALVTLHRPSNVDDSNVLKRILGALGEIAARMPVIIPLHPRTAARVQEFGLGDFLQAPGMVALPPASYLAMLGLMESAALVLTDSGGIQEETTALGVPCLTLRENTERPITISEGTNSLVGTDPKAIRTAFTDVMTSGGKRGRIPEYWDGQAAKRIAAALKARL